MAEEAMMTEETPVVDETAETEVEGVETEMDEATRAEKEKEEAKKAARAEKAANKKAAHSVKHQASVALVDKNKQYPLEEALDLVKKTSYTNFDGSVDVHVRFNIGKKNEDAIRGMVVLPHGTGRERKVVIITEEMIEKIEKGWLDFDVAVATPVMMPKLARLAKILGPKGLMPNPKSGTVSDTPEKVAEELKGGRVEFKTDSLSNTHQVIGKLSWANTKLAENFTTFVGALPKSRIKSVTIAPTMGAGVKVQI